MLKTKMSDGTKNDIKVKIQHITKLISKIIEINSSSLNINLKVSRHQTVPPELTK